MRILAAHHVICVMSATVAIAAVAVAFVAPVYSQQSDQAAAPQTQKIYRWKDARGITHYSQDPPRSSKYTTREFPIPTSAPATRSNSPAPAAPAASTDIAPDAAVSEAPQPATPVTPAPSAPSATSSASTPTTSDARPAATPATTATTSPAAPSQANTAPNQRCATAHKNLQALQGDGPVLIDSDGDGKPEKPLNDVERNNQLELARATLKAYNCGDGTPAADQN